MTSAASMPTARALRMVVGTGITAIVLTLLFNRLAGVNDAQARVTGTFHLSHSRHGSLLNR